MKRVFVTGLGAITPIGNDTETYWRNLLAGKSGAGYVTQFDPGEMPYTMACEVKDFDPTDFMDRKTSRRMDLFCQFAMAAAVEAVESSDLKPEKRDRDRIGVFEAANKGTVFLDEIGDVEHGFQLKLLRFLQERQIRPIGSPKARSVDVRVIAATNQDLQARVAAGRFRQDLFYRLHIVPIQLPPLRERRQDIPLLVEHFLGKLARRTGKNITAVEPAALQMLQDYPWPGNVRELENVVEQAMVFAEGDTIRTGDLPSALCQRAAPEQAPGADPGLSVLPGSEGLPLPQILEQLERRLILQAYQKANRVKTETARLLGIKPSALYYKLEKYEID